MEILVEVLSCEKFEVLWIVKDNSGTETGFSGLRISSVLPENELTSFESDKQTFRFHQKHFPR